MTRIVRSVVLALMASGAALLVPAAAEAQLGALISPGQLTRAHADLEGVSQCTRCHERGRRVAAEKCLSCHKPVAQRIAARVGIHRDVTDDCVRCHVEHHGRDGELRPFDRTKFNHDRDTSFPLAGKHAALASRCESCHTTRSFLDAKTACAACHNDVHRGDLGSDCQQCHSVVTPFTAAARSFDHRKTDFPLTGAHASAECTSCHKTRTYTGVQFASCANCHESPHPKTMAGTCASCHSTATWSTKRFNHDATAFHLAGRHADVACASCHKGPPLTSKTEFSTCAACHADPHRGEFAEGCDACHTEKGFTSGRFDHDGRTRFPLTAGHANVACTSCHTGVTLGRVVAKTTADFRGTPADCVACHADPHAQELGNACTTCHDTTTFALTRYDHVRRADLIAGRHVGVACDQCHRPAVLATSTSKVALAGSRFTATPATCVSCHEDVHDGQVGTECAACHSLDAASFAADRFSHERSAFTLTGAHTSVACEDCHRNRDSRRVAPAAPRGRSSVPVSARPALPLKGIGTTCAACHADVHLGQVAATCDRCHNTRTFDIGTYTHKKKDPQFFTGPHVSAGCASCHKTVTGRFPAGAGTTVQFTISTDCASCHDDVHRGAMGRDCRACHKVTGRLNQTRESQP